MTSDRPLSRRQLLGRSLAALAAGVGLGRAARAEAAGASPMGSEQPYIAEIRMFAGNFAPVGWMFCHGQLLPISENEALFSLIGTTYGGNGETTFALPDLRGRVPIHMGTGSSGITYQIGEMAGVESTTLLVQQIPSHTHAPGAASQPGDSDNPAGRVPARNAAGVPEYATSPNATLAAGALFIAGGSQPHTNLQPYLGINYIIALFGVYPSQS